MTQADSPLSQPLFASSRLRPLLLICFVASGCAALIYEIVWFQLLSLVVGSSAVSLGVLLAVFMGGMCLGSISISRFVPKGRHPLLVYTCLELGIGILGLLIYFGLPKLAPLYVALGGSGAVGLLIRAIFSACFLLPPTILMGATLPAIARWIESTPRGVSWLGFLYGGNTVGAVFGCLLAGFYLLRVHDMGFATFVAAAINFVLAGIAFVMVKETSYAPDAGKEFGEGGDYKIPRGSWPVLLSIAFSGATALGAEVVWTRLLGLLLGATTYTFSLILGAVLIGLGVGSTAGSWVARSTDNPRRALGICQLLLMGGLAWAGYAMEQSLPYWPVSPGLSSAPSFLFQLDFARCLWVVIPSALLWGASFPLSLAAVASRGTDQSRMVGIVYASNTVGAIIGALVSSLGLLGGGVGTQHSQQIMIILAGLSAILVLVPTVSPAGDIEMHPRGAVWLGSIIVACFLFARSIIPVPAVLVAFGRNTASWLNSHGEFIFVGEGLNSSMAVSRLSNGVLNYHNAGKTQASSEPQDMRLQLMLGHLTTLIPDNPKRILVIGCGAGVTAGAVSVEPMLERETIAEIETLVPQEVAGKRFTAVNFDVIHNPKVDVHVDDARHYLLTTKEKFDAITSDPFDPWVKGAASLYTAEFFKIAKAHLNPGGVVTVFVQLYETGEAGVKSEVASFLEAFPNGMLFANNVNGQGYDTVLVGQAEPSKFDIDKIEARLARPEYATMRESLAGIGFNSATDLFATFVGRAAELKPWLADAQVNHDSNLRLQYLAGLGLNQYNQDEIYQNMARNRKWPEDLFIATPERMTALHAAFDAAQ